MSEHEAGRELDALVAERVFGLRVEILPAPEHGHQHGKNVPMEPQSCDPPPGMLGAWAAMYWVIPRYSTDISAAWEVLERMRERGEWVLNVMADGYEIDNHNAEAIPLKGWTWDDEWIAERADTAPLCICRAALKAIE